MSSYYENDPELLKTLQDPLAAAQPILSKTIAGEENNAPTLFLTLSSYLSPNPLSAIIQGDSSLGKSHLTGNVLKLFPENDVVKISRSTKAWLDYIGDSLSHRILYFFQLRDQDRSESLHILLSEDGVEIGTVVKSGGGHKSETRKTSGRFSLISTTVYQYEPQMATRVINIHPDESPEQTARIVAAQQKNSKYPWMLTSLSYDEIRKAISWVRDCGVKEVVIPFANLISVSTQYSRARRDWLKVEGLVKSLAMLRQTSRDIIEVEGRRYVVAEWRDYLDVVKVAGIIINQTLTGITDREKMILNAVNENFGGMEFSVGQLVDCMQRRVQLGNVAMKRQLAVLMGKGYIDQTRVGGGNSKSNLYRLVTEVYHKLPGELLLEVDSSVLVGEVEAWRTSLENPKWYRYDGLKLVRKETENPNVCSLHTCSQACHRVGLVG